MYTPKTILPFALLAATLLTTIPARAQTVGQTVGRPQATLTQQLARFAGPWVAHGVGMHLDVDAHAAEISMRTYNWCGPRVSPPCDRITGNIITPGLAVLISIHGVQGDTAISSVLRTTDMHSLPLGAYVGLTLLPHGRMFLDDERFGLNSRTLCNEHYFDQHPGAYAHWWNCGA